MPPQTGEVWLAVEGTRCRSGQVRLAVASAGCSWRGKVQPLRVSARRENREQEKQSLMSHLAILAVGVHCRMDGSGDRARLVGDPEVTR